MSEHASVPACLLILSLLQGKQNLWCGCEGHCTKCVSSSLSWHNVHLRVGADGGGGGSALSEPALAPSALPTLSVEVTDVVDDTCREPDDLRPLDEPVCIISH